MNRPLAGPQTLLRTLNARAILETLARRGPLTRAELISETRLSRTAVTQVLLMLEAADAVVASGVDRETRGPAATRMALHPELGFAAAVRVDRRTMHVVLVDAHGAVRAEGHGRVGAGDDRAASIAALVDDVRSGRRGRLHLATVAVPGIVTEDGAVRDDAGSDAGAFRSALAGRLGCPVRIENDVNLAALAELDSGAGRGLDSFALLHLGEGLGAGLVVDGRLHRGSHGVAGEVAYLPQAPVPLGEPIVSDAVIAELAREAGMEPGTPLEEQLVAAEVGDPIARLVVDEIARRLSLVAAGVALVLDPELFILGGAAAHPTLAAAVERSADTYALRLPLRFRRSELGHEAPLAGAVAEATSALRTTLLHQLVPVDRNPA